MNNIRIMILKVKCCLKIDNRKAKRKTTKTIVSSGRGGGSEKRRTHMLGDLLANTYYLSSQRMAFLHSSKAQRVSTIYPTCDLSWLISMSFLLRVSTRSFLSSSSSLLKARPPSSRLLSCSSFSTCRVSLCQDKVKQTSKENIVCNITVSSNCAQPCSSYHYLPDRNKTIMPIL